MDAGIVVEHHAGVEDAVGIQQPLDPLHQRVRRFSPLVPDEGRHVASGAVVLPDHEVDQVPHEGAVARGRLRAREVLAEDEVQVAVARVAEDHRLRKAVALEKRLQVSYRLGQPLHRHHHVLDQDRGAGGAHAAHGREEPLAQVPVSVARGGVGGEVDGGEEPEAGERLLPAPYGGRERGGVGAAELGQYGRRPVADGEGPPFVGLGAQRGGVHDLEGHRAGAHEWDHRPPRFGQLREIHESGGALDLRPTRSSGTVRSVASARKPSVPSEPTIRWARIWAGESWSRRAWRL